jgi:hypothetical protein
MKDKFTDTVDSEAVYDIIAQNTDLSMTECVSIYDVMKSMHHGTIEDGNHQIIWNKLDKRNEYFLMIKEID